MQARVILVRHDHHADEDRVVTHLRRHAIPFSIVRPFAGEALPTERADVAGCVIYGGLYNVYDTGPHPFLMDEYAFIQRCLDWDVPMLGICQGAQEIAWHLGAHVGPAASGVHEFGYYELLPSADAGDFLPPSLHMVQSHWHGFDLPEGATRLAASASFPNQAYRIGDKVYGFQFHAEATPAIMRRMQEGGAGRYGLPGVQFRDEQDRLMAAHDARQAEWFFRFLDRLFPPASA
jgi:GMP synthase (glutamine-hydrolysing)